MVSASKHAIFSLKVMMNKKKDKVLFAEADSDFVDVLLSFLTLPLGKIPGLLKKHHNGTDPSIGSLTTLYEGLSNLSDAHFLSADGKKTLLNPRNTFESECRELKVNLDYDTSTSGEESCNKRKSVKTEADDGDGDAAGVFTEKTMSFLISDDLKVAPVVKGSILKSLSGLGIKDVGGAEMRVVTVEIAKIVDLLVESLRSETTLTSVFGKKLDVSEYDLCFPRLDCLRRWDLRYQMTKEPVLDFKNTTVTAILQKSTNNVLFVLAGEDFVDYLFSSLSISIGGVKSLLGNITNISLVAIDNLYKSLKNLKNNKHPKLGERINRLIEPELPLKFIGKGNNESYVKGSAMFMVSDGLKVTPLSVTSSISVLNRMGIPLSDVKEEEMHVGVEEFLSILRASLLSPFALADGLANPILKKRPN